MAENTDADLLLQLGMTMTKMNRQLAQAEARFNRTAQKIERDFNRANQASVEKTVSAATKMEGAFTKLGRVAGTVLGVVIGQGILQISANVGKAIKSLADLADQADRVGSSLEEYQGLQFGFQLAGVDNAAFVQGMEMFTQRIGEAAEGSGDLYDLLRENGIAIRGLDGEIRPVNDLLRDFADLIQQAGSESEQMAMLNDAFGRSGRGLLLAMRDGAQGLEEMGVAAEEAGIILEDSLIRRAGELDDRLDVVKAQAQALISIFSVYGGEAAIGLAEIVQRVVNLFTEVGRLEERLKESPLALQALGIELEAVSELTAEQAASANDLLATYDAVANAALRMADQLQYAANGLEAMGRTGAAEALRQVANAMVSNAQGYLDGDVAAQQLLETMDLMSNSAETLFGTLNGVDSVTFGGVTSALAGFVGMLDTAIARAQTLRASLPTYTPTMPTGGPGTFPVSDNTGNFNNASPLAPGSVTLPPNRPGFDWYFGSGDTGGASPGGSGGSPPDQGLSPWFTDDQEQQILDAYDALKEAQSAYNQSVEDGAMVVADLFTSVIDGSKSAEEAIADLLAQLAQVQIQKAVLGLAEGGGFWGSVFSALGGATSTPSLDVPSFAGGGYTGSGSRSGGADGKGGFPALLHPNETVIDHSKGGSAGGGQVSVVVRMEGGNLVPVIEQVSGNVTARAMTSFQRQLPSMVGQINRNPRDR